MQSWCFGLRVVLGQSSIATCPDIINVGLMVALSERSRVAVGWSLFGAAQTNLLYVLAQAFVHSNVHIMMHK